MKINIYRVVDKIAGGIICGILGLLKLSTYFTACRYLIELSLRLKKPCNLPWSGFLLFACRKIDFSTISSVVIIKLWAVGESVLTLPMIEALKKKNPALKIVVLARNRNKAVYGGQKFIDEILLFEPKNILKLISFFKKFDLAVDCEPYLNISAIAGRWFAKRTIGFSHGIRSRLYDEKMEYDDAQHVVHTYLDFARKFGVSAKCNSLAKLKYGANDESQVNLLLSEHKISKKDFVVGICPSVAESSKDRMWPNEYYAKVIDELTKKYRAKIILVGGKNDYLHNESIKELCSSKEKVFNFAGRTSLKQLFALVEHCNLFISNDTGPMHIAAAQGIQTIGLFGPNLPARFAPYGRKNVSLCVKQNCSPCINVHKGSFPECCNMVKGKCMKELKPEFVLGAVEKCVKQ